MFFYDTQRVNIHAYELFDSVPHSVLLIHQRDQAGDCKTFQFFLSDRPQRVATGTCRKSCLLCANAGLGPLLPPVQHE